MFDKSRTYYLTKTDADRYDLRQTRYVDQFKAGKEHPHDLLAVGFTAQDMRKLVATHKFDVDLTLLDK